MARQASPMKPTRIRHSQAYKDEALALAEQIGVSQAAEQLGLQPSQLYGWRSKQQQNQAGSEREQLLADENARLKRLLAEQAGELAIVKIYGPSVFAILINNECLACLNLSGVWLGHARATMRVTPGDPEKAGGFESRFLRQVLRQAGGPFMLSIVQSSQNPKECPRYRNNHRVRRREHLVLL
ncbi:hypothetical protein GCM10027398_33340 [Azotobacter salinestris]